MAYPVPIYILLLVCISVTVPCGNALLRKYLSLISDVQEFYGTKRIYLVMSHENQHSDEYQLAYLMSRELSRKGVQTSIIQFHEIFERTKTHHKQDVRPLIVVLLTAVGHVNTFVETTLQTKISYPIWLMIFADEFDSQLREHCDRPMENIFRLRFDTEMLVSCGEDPELKEWWAIRENETEATSFGNWTIEDGLKVLVERNLYRRRYNLKGTGFRLALVEVSAFRPDEGGEYGGLFFAMLMELKQIINFDITSIEESDAFGGWDQTKQRWSGAIGRVHRGAVDLGVAEFAITKHRLDAVDFTLPIVWPDSQMYVKKLDGSEVQWSSHFKAFSFPIWLSIILLMFVSTLLVTLMKMRPRKRPFLHLFLEHFLYVWGIFCQQGLAVLSVETPLRIAYCSTFIAALVVSAAYSGALTSFMTVSTSRLPFTSVEEFISDGSYSLVVISNTADYDFFITTSDPLMSKVKTFMKPQEHIPRTMIDAFQQVCTEKVAYYAIETVMITRRKYIPCNVATVDTGFSDGLGMITQPESQYTGVINYNIQRFRENGIIDRLERVHLKEFDESQGFHNEISFWGVAPILMILVGGMALAFFILLCEMLHKTVSKLKRNCREVNADRMNSRRICMDRRL